jgi:hypothetical protein
MADQTRVRCLASLLLALPVLLAAEDFHLREQKVKAPEMGEVLSYILVCGADEFSFMPPADWRVKVEPDRRRLVFQSTNNTASIFLAVSGPNPALQAGTDPESLRQEVRQQFTGARIIEQFPCYTSSHAGRGFDVEWIGGGQVPMTSRVACFATSGRTVEFTLTTMAGRFWTFRPVLGALLTSFRQNRTSVASGVHGDDSPKQFAP